MWVMTSFGIFMPGLRPEGTVPEGDNRVLQVRARRKIDLERLRDLYMGDELGEPISLKHTDYEWRAYCTLEAWGRALAKIGEDIDYVKFKETAEKKFNDHDLHSAYLKIWSSLFSHFSTQAHQDDYWGTSLYGSVGKYGTTYAGTGNFTTSDYPAKGKGKKGKGKGVGSKYASTGAGRQPWWADADSAPKTTHWWDDDDAYVEDYDDLGLGRRAREDAERDFREELASLKRGNGRHGTGNVDFGNLYDMLLDMDPALKPVINADGEIDHLYCDHGISKSAKKRCRARWRRYAVQRDSREFGSAR